MKIYQKFFAVFLLLLVLPLQGCATAYSAKEIEAWVIDAETKQPLEGVNVVAHWVLSFGMEGGQQTDLMLMESVTDKDGRFYFPAWGPVSIPASLPWEARMKNQDPAIIIFKPGYQWVGLSNEITGPYPDAGPAMRTSRWNGKIIAMKKFEGSLDRYGSMVDGVLTGVSYGQCRWKNIPRILVALDKESGQLRKRKVFTGLPTISKIEDISVGKGCGSVKEFFKDYLK